MNEQDYMKNAAGHLVPKANVSEKDQMQDGLVRMMVARAAEHAKTIETFKQLAFGEVDAFVDLVVEKYGAKRPGGSKGNVQLVSYDGTMKMVVAVDTLITFGPELQAARNLIDQCIERWAEGANGHLVTLVNDAFRANSDGKLSAGRVLGLRRLDIDDDQWRAAMDALGEAVQETGTKRYVRFYKRRETDGAFEQVALG